MYVLGKTRISVMPAPVLASLKEKSHHYSGWIFLSHAKLVFIELKDRR